MCISHCLRDILYRKVMSQCMVYNDHTRQYFDVYTREEPLELKILYSPNKHGKRINNTNTIKTIRTTQLQSRHKHLKLDSNLDTRLAHDKLGKAKPKYLVDKLKC